MINILKYFENILIKTLYPCHGYRSVRATDSRVLAPRRTSEIIIYFRIFLFVFLTFLFSSCFEHLENSFEQNKQHQNCIIP